jgi:hypothetical protein
MPEETPSSLPSLVRTRVLRLNPMIIGLTFGFICGAALMLVTIVLLLKGGSVIGPHLALLNQVFVGFRVTWFGSLIGFAYAGATGFAAGYCGAVLYNWIAGNRRRATWRR